MDFDKKYLPPSEFCAQAHVGSEAVAERFRDTAQHQSEAFWKELSKALIFDEPFKEVLEWNCPEARWFVGGKINVSKNCLDRHAQKTPNRRALVWEGEPLEIGKPELRTLSYKELLELCCQIANTLTELEVKKGDRVAIYMPMVPETVASMLACARIGAIHTVVFAGFSASSLADRLKDSGAKVLITADGTYRKGKFLDLKAIVNQALDLKIDAVEKVLVFERKPGAIKEWEKRDLPWTQTVARAKKTCPALPLDTEDPLFILYTSGTTGKPKGLFHSQAGYLLGAHWSTRWLFDLKDSDLFFCTADCGWITGHTYIAYGPLSNGGTILMYEGAPLHPTASRIWEIIDRHQVSILYTAPTAIRLFMKMGSDFVKKSKLNSLRLLGTVGEPINPEAWAWYFKEIGKEKCPIVDTWWQTETGSAMIAPFPGATPLKAGSATLALPGIAADIVNPETGKSCAAFEKGALVIKKPWPSMARGIWGDKERFDKTYWNTSPALKGIYFTGDMAIKDEDEYFWIEGRMDDVLNVSGHRIGSAELESAVIEHPSICEAAAVGVPHEIKGQGIAIFFSINESTVRKIHSNELTIEQIKKEASDLVVREIGAHARPDQLRLAKALPKTRSGKIMRRLLRQLAISGKISGDISTLEDFSAEAAMNEEV